MTKAFSGPKWAWHDNHARTSWSKRHCNAARTPPHRRVKQNVVIDPRTGWQVGTKVSSSMLTFVGVSSHNNAHLEQTTSKRHVSETCRRSKRGRQRTFICQAQLHRSRVEQGSVEWASWFTVCACARHGVDGCVPYFGARLYKLRTFSFTKYLTGWVAVNRISPQDQLRPSRSHTSQSCSRRCLNRTPRQRCSRQSRGSRRQALPHQLGFPQTCSSRGRHSRRSGGTPHRNQLPVTRENAGISRHFQGLHMKQRNSYMCVRPPRLVALLICPSPRTRVSTSRPLAAQLYIYVTNSFRAKYDEKEAG